MRNLSKILFIGSLVLIFSACSTTKSPNSISTVGGATATEAGAETSSLGQQGGFAENNNSNKLRAPYDQTYYFDFDSDAVHSDDLASIKAQCDYLVNHPNAKVRISGNTDERGSREYNVALGWRRAQSVAAIMQQQGVASSQIDLISFGEEKPVALGHDEDSWQQNRRDELTYEAK